MNRERDFQKAMEHGHGVVELAVCACMWVRNMRRELLNDPARAAGAAPTGRSLILDPGRLPEVKNQVSHAYDHPWRTADSWLQEAWARLFACCSRRCLHA